MRSIKELLTLVLLRIESQTDLYSGICYEITNLCEKDSISLAEHQLLIRYVKDNRPKWYSKHYLFEQRTSGWYWPRGEVAPRVAWLKSRIKKEK